MKEPTGGRLVNLFVDLFDRFVAPGLRPSLLHHLPGLYSKPPVAQIGDISLLEAFQC